MRHYSHPNVRAVPLIPDKMLAAAAQDRRNRRPISVNKRGAIKCSGKWSPRKVAAARKATMENVRGFTA